MDSASTLIKKKSTKRGPSSKKAAAQAAPTPSDSSNTLRVPPDVSATHEQVHRAALLASIAGQPFEDVKFVAFSRRTRSGSVDTPLPLVANSRHIRKVAPYFNFVFGSGFAEGEVLDMDAPYPPARPSITETYDYQSDSDLEDEEVDLSEEHTCGNGADAANNGATTRIEQETQSESKGEDKADVTTDEAALVATDPKRIAKPGRVVYLEDVACTTWKAFIYYTYFQELNFAPLKSQLKSRPALEHDSHTHIAPICSPKSMYRVAHKYDIPSLKLKALDDIKAKLSPLNIFEELFSTFTSLYSDVRDVELEYLNSNIKDTGIQARLPVWLDMLEKNQLPDGSSAIFASLFSKLSIPGVVQPKSHGGLFSSEVPVTRSPIKF